MGFGEKKNACIHNVTKHWRRDFNSHVLRFPEQQGDESFFSHSVTFKLFMLRKDTLKKYSERDTLLHGK